MVMSLHNKAHHHKSLDKLSNEILVFQSGKFNLGLDVHYHLYVAFFGVVIHLYQVDPAELYHLLACKLALKDVVQH